MKDFCSNRCLKTRSKTSAFDCNFMYVYKTNTFIIIYIIYNIIGNTMTRESLHINKHLKRLQIVPLFEFTFRIVFQLFAFLLEL